MTAPLPKTLVIGKSGQLARALVHAASGLPAFGREDGADLADPGTVAALVKAQAPALVINAAAYTAVDRAESEPEAAAAINEHGVAALARATADVGAALVHVSTDYVYDGAKPTPWVEDDPTGPLSVYGRTKLAGEAAALAANPRTLVLRTSWVYSPFGRNFVLTMLGLAERERLTVVGDQVGAPTSALDLAAAILTIAPRLADSGPEAGVWGVRHYAGAGETSWAGFASAIFETARGTLIERAPPVEPIPTEQYPTAATRPRNSRLDCTRFERDFGVAMVPWRDALAEVIALLAAERAAGE